MKNFKNKIKTYYGEIQSSAINHFCNEWLDQNEKGYTNMTLFSSGKKTNKNRFSIMEWTNNNNNKICFANVFSFFRILKKKLNKCTKSLKYFENNLKIRRIGRKVQQGMPLKMCNNWGINIFPPTAYLLIKKRKKSNKIRVDQ